MGFSVSTAAEMGGCHQSMFGAVFGCCVSESGCGCYLVSLSPRALHLSHYISPLISYYPSKVKYKRMAGDTWIALDTQGKSTLIGSKRNWILKKGYSKLKMQVPGKEHWQTLFSAIHHPVSILGSLIAQLSYGTAQCLEESYQSLWDDTHRLLCFKLISLFLVRTV